MLKKEKQQTGDVSYLQERLSKLEEEKNALLDYIEENVEKNVDPTAMNHNNSRKGEEMEMRHQEEMRKLREELDEAHKMLQARVEDYHSLSRQMNENTFGNILPPIFSPNTPNDTLQLRSPTAFDSVNNPIKQENE